MTRALLLLPLLLAGCAIGFAAGRYTAPATKTNIVMPQFQLASEDGAGWGAASVVCRAVTDEGGVWVSYSQHVTKADLP